MRLPYLTACGKKRNISNNYENIRDRSEFKTRGWSFLRVRAIHFRTENLGEGVHVSINVTILNFDP